MKQKNWPLKSYQKLWTPPNLLLIKVYIISYYSTTTVKRYTLFTNISTISLNKISLINKKLFLVEMATLQRENKQTVTNILEKHEVEKLITEYEKMEAEIAAAKAEAKAKEKKEKDAKEKDQSS